MSSREKPKMEPFGGALMANEGIILMSEKERETLVVMERVKRKEIKLADAAEVLSISYRQCSRRWGRYQEGGAVGLVHGSRGAVSNRRVSEEVGARIVELYGGDYKGFGPVLQ